MPEYVLKRRWEGGDGGSEKKRRRGEVSGGVLPGKTRKWKTFWGLGFEWILEEGVGVGGVEVFDTGCVGRGVRCL